MSEFPLETNLIPADASLYSERLGEDSKGDLWVRSFLINDKLNARGWRINPATLRQNVVSIIGKPLVLYRTPRGRIDHPDWRVNRSAEANIKNQEQYAVGRASRVLYDKEHDNYYVDIKVTDPQAKAHINSFHERKVPLAVSPQLTWTDESPNKPNYYTNWNFTHLAIVEQGAYGPDAKITHVCTGEEDTCHNQFQNTAASAASAPAPPLNDEAFCKTQALKDASASISQNFDTSHVTQTGNFTSSQNMAEPMVEVTKDNSPVKQTDTAKVSVPANSENSLTLNIRAEQPFFRNAPSINEQAKQQVEEVRKADENKKISKPGGGDEQQQQQPNQQQQDGQESTNTAADKQRIADLEKEVKRLTKESQEAAAQRRLAEVATAVPKHLPEFWTENGKFRDTEYNKTVEDFAAKPYSIADIHFLFEPRVKAFEQNFSKSLGLEPNAEQMAQQAVTNAPAPAKASAPEIYKVPETKKAEASSVRKVPEFIQVPPNGKRPGRLA